jgi:hypothetical protein
MIIHIMPLDPAYPARSGTGLAGHLPVNPSFQYSNPPIFQGFKNIIKLP